MYLDIYRKALKTKDSRLIEMVEELTRALHLMTKYGKRRSRDTSIEGLYRRLADDYEEKLARCDDYIKRVM